MLVTTCDVGKLCVYTVWVMWVSCVYILCVCVCVCAGEGGGGVGGHLGDFRDPPSLPPPFHSSPFVEDC